MSGAEMRDSEEVKDVRLTESASAHSCPGHAPAPYLVYVGLGANLGDRRASLRRALRLLAHVEDTRLLRVSSFYETPPWGNEKQPPFLNACAALETRLLPLVFLRRTQRIERALGRVRKEHWGPRTIDIDLLFAEGHESARQELRLPHPYLHERAFVLLPLAEIAPGLIVRGRGIDEWLAELSDTAACLRRGGAYRPRKNGRKVFLPKEKLSFLVRTW